MRIRLYKKHLYIAAAAFVLLVAGAIYAQSSCWAIVDGKACSTGGNDPIMDSLTNYTHLPPSEFKFYSASAEDSVILDIRTPAEVGTGKIAEAINVDYYASDFQAKLRGLNKNKTYFVYCRSGNRSTQAVELMRQMGFPQVFGLQGGIDAWVGDGLAVEETGS